MADMPWPLQGTSGHIVTLVARLVALCGAHTIHAAFVATVGAMHAYVSRSQLLCEPFRLLSFARPVRPKALSVTS